MPIRQPSAAYLLLHAYRRGWKQGATSGAIDSKREPEENRAEYERGAADGRAALGAASKAAIDRLGVSQDELRLAVLR